MLGFLCRIHLLQLPLDVMYWLLFINLLITSSRVVLNVWLLINPGLDGVDASPPFDAGEQGGTEEISTRANIPGNTLH